MNQEKRILVDLIQMKEVDLPNETRVCYSFYCALTVGISKMLPEKMQEKCREMARRDLKDEIKKLAVKSIAESAVKLSNPVELRDIKMMVMRNVELDRPLLLVSPKASRRDMEVEG